MSERLRLAGMGEGEGLCSASIQALRDVTHNNAERGKERDASSCYSLIVRGYDMMETSVRGRRRQGRMSGFRFVVEA